MDVRNNNYNNENVISNAVLFNKTASTQRSIKCPLSGKDAPILDYKNLELLRKYVSEKGRILPSRVTGISRKKQRALQQCIMRARNLAMLPFATK